MNMRTEPFDSTLQTGNHSASSNWGRILSRILILVDRYRQKNRMFSNTKRLIQKNILLSFDGYKESLTENESKKLFIQIEEVLTKNHQKYYTRRVVCVLFELINLHRELIPHGDSINKPLILLASLGETDYFYYLTEVSSVKAEESGVCLDLVNQMAIREAIDASERGTRHKEYPIPVWASNLRRFSHSFMDDSLSRKPNGTSLFELIIPLG